MIRLAQAPRTMSPPPADGTQQKRVLERSGDQARERAGWATLLKREVRDVTPTRAARTASPSELHQTSNAMGSGTRVHTERAGDVVPRRATAPLGVHVQRNHTERLPVTVGNLSQKSAL